MRKHFLLFCFAVAVFLLFTRTSCEHDYDYDEKLVSVEADNMDNAGQDMILAGQSVKKEAFVLGVKLFSSMKDWQNEWSGAYFSRKMEFVNTVGNVKVFTNTDFSSSYPKGSDVSHLFDTYFRQTEDYDKPEPPFDVYTYLLVLREAPDVGEHSFKIVYQLKDDEAESIVLDTEPILLN